MQDGHECPNQTSTHSEMSPECSPGSIWSFHQEPKRDYMEDSQGLSREGLPHSKCAKLQHLVQLKWRFSGDALEDTPPKVAKLASLGALIPEFKGTNGEHWQPIY